MFKKRSIMLFMVLALSLMVLATGCGNEEAESTITPEQTQTPEVVEVNEEEILTQAAIDYFNYMQGVNMIDVAKTYEQLENLAVIDIRSAEDFNNGHIPGAINVPMASMGEKIPELSTNQTYVIVCYSGQTASQTTGVLRMAGFDALVLKGGYPSWENAGYDIEK